VVADQARLEARNAPSQNAHPVLMSVAMEFVCGTEGTRFSECANFAPSSLCRSGGDTALLLLQVENGGKQVGTYLLDHDWLTHDTSAYSTFEEVLHVLFVDFERACVKLHGRSGRVDSQITLHRPGTYLINWLCQFKWCESV